MSEAAIVLVLFVAGWLVLSAHGLRGWGLIPLGLLVGAMQAVASAGLLLVAGLAASPWRVLGLVLAVSTTFALVRVRRASTSLPWNMLAVGAGVVFPLVILFRGANLVAYHIDSFRYLVVSGLLTNDLYEIAGRDLLEKRLLAAPVLHSFAQLDGEWYLRSITPLISLSVVAFTVWTLQQRYRALPPQHVVAVGGLAALLLITNNRWVWNSFYINDHLFFGMAFVVAAAAAWLLERADESGNRRVLLHVLAVALPALVVTRPEGFIAGTFIVLPLALSPLVDRRDRVRVVMIHAYAILLWFGFVAMELYSRAGSLRASAVGPALLGVLGLALLPLIARQRLVEKRRLLLLVFEIALWAVLGLFALRDPVVLRSSLSATFENVVGGAGGWGWSLIVLGALGLVTLAAARGNALTQLRFPLTAMLPAFFLLAYLRGGAYRVGNGDSLNRMLIEVVPLLVLYIAAGLLQRASDQRSGVETAPPESAPSSHHPSVSPAWMGRRGPAVS